jgi:hydrogenase maturation factor
MLRGGKLPQHVLSGLLAQIPHNDPRILLGPAVGRDAAVVDIGGGRVLVATSDPITFATEDIGRYAVHVNANDVACMGAAPAWFMATILLPEGADPELPGEILDQMLSAAAELNIELIGGHTEVTAGIDRPIVAGTMLGECARKDIVAGEDIVPGDAVVLCGSIAIEGTALLAREAVVALDAAGVPAATIEAARVLLRDPGISVLPSVRRLKGIAKARLMHDPTEGGVATALAEMAEAAGITLSIDLEAIDVLPETQAVCAALGLNALGLLASGALVAVMPKSAAEQLVGNATPGVRVIGRIESGPGRVILSDGTTPFPSFDRDELARFFEGLPGSKHMNNILEGSEST